MEQNIEIKDLGQDTFLVGRFVLKGARSGTFDPGDPESRAEMVRISETQFKGRHSRAIYGPLTVCVLAAIPEGCAGPGGARPKYTRGQMHFSSLHEGARGILRKEFPEYADKI